MIRFVCFDSGSVHCLAIFDKIEKSEEVYELINTFNSHHSWLSLYIHNINGSDFLEAHYSVLECSDTMNAITNARKFLDILVADSTAELLLPLTELTHK